MITIDSAGLLCTYHGINSFRMFRLYPICYDYDVFKITCKLLNLTIAYGEVEFRTRISAALDEDQLELAQWFYKKDKYIEYKYCSNIRGLLWLQTICDLNINYIFERACTCGHINIMEWALPYVTALPDVKSPIKLRFANANCFKWLLDHGAKYDSHAIDVAAEHGSLDIVKMLHQHGECSIRAINYAVKHTHIIEWMHDNCECGYIGDIMEEIIMNGSVSSMKYMHEVYNVEITSTIFIDIIAEGNIHGIEDLDRDTVSLIYADRFKDCIGMLTYVKSCGIECDDKCFHWMAQFGYLEGLIWLLDNYTCSDLKCLLNVAYKYDQLDIVEYIKLNIIID